MPNHFSSDAFLPPTFARSDMPSRSRATTRCCSAIRPVSLINGGASRIERLRQGQILAWRFEPTKNYINGWWRNGDRTGGRSQASSALPRGNDC